MKRRQFLANAARAGVAGLGLGGLHKALAATAGPTTAIAAPDGFGALTPQVDPNTGQVLLRLPQGFHYHSLTLPSDILGDGSPAPRMPDGMGCFQRPDGDLALLRNHELSTTGATFAPGAPSYDPGAGGGVTRLILDSENAQLRSVEAALTGTLRNCAGGPTPWGSWITCEETVAGKGDLRGLEEAHGFAFEVPAQGLASGRPLTGMGRFFHEAAAVSPDGDEVYLTEDRTSAGFYRFRPEKPRDFEGPGVLEMLAIDGAPRVDLRRGVPTGQIYPAAWVPVKNPQQTHSRQKPGDTLCCFSQGSELGGATFARLEGSWLGGGRVLFASTNGGDAGAGQVWAYHAEEELLELVWEAPHRKLLANPDNLVVSPRGGVLVCEDGWGRPQRLQALGPDGVIEAVAENACVLRGDIAGLRGDFRATEFAGACFSPDGRWLFVNLQKPAITLAITGPWERGGL